jgi:hypothetical protein
MDQSIIPECYVDTNLIETLVPPNGQYNHQKGCGTVTKVMRTRFFDRFAIGIIDKDKIEVEYLREFTEVCTKGSLILHKHKIRHHYIIQIHPAMEKFIMSNAASAGISLSDFDLPTGLDEFKHETKKVNSKNDYRFRRLFKTLHNNGAPEIIRLSAWIKLLKEQNYTVDINAFKDI